MYLYNILGGWWVYGHARILRGKQGGRTPPPGKSQSNPASTRCSAIIEPFQPRHEISNNMVCATSKASDQPAHMRSLIRAFASRLNIL